MKRSMMTVLAVVAMAFALTGCGGKKVDATTPVPQLKESAQKMDAPSIQKTIDSYRAAITDKQADLQKLADKIKTMPVAQMLGEEAKKLKADSDQVQTEIQALNDRLQVYVDALKDKAVVAK